MSTRLPLGGRNHFRVLQSCTSPSWGGLEMQALLVCTELMKRGHDVTLLCSPATRMEVEANRAGVRTLPLESRNSRYPFSLGAVRRFLIDERIQIVHSQLSHDLNLLVPAAVYIPQPPPILLTKRVGSFIRKKDFFHRWLYQHVSLVIAISEVIRKNIIETCPINPDRIVTVYDGVDLERFDCGRVDRRAVRGELGLKEREIVIGMVGRFSPGKGHEEFLAAAHSIHRQFPEVKFLIVGDASFGEEAYASSIREAGRPLVEEGALQFTGFRADVPAIMGAMDILAFPSYAEAFGDVLIEAMAMELPVVSTNCDGVLEIVADGETGIQVPARSGEALAEALILLVRDSDLRRRLGMSGRKRVEELFNLERRTDRIEELYAKLLFGGPEARQLAQVAAEEQSA
jgi:glycosyltransferase involved in cell wall biosynthesis